MNIILSNNEFKPIYGNPTLTSLDGEIRAPLQTILHSSWTPEERAAFGVYQVDTTPPEGKQFTGVIDNVDGVPTPVFVDLPSPEEQLAAYREGLQTTPRKARIVLANAGILNDIPTVIASLPPEDQVFAEIEWNHAQVIKRMNPLVVALTPLLDVTAEQLDDMFEYANQIPD